MTNNNSSFDYIRSLLKEVAGISMQKDKDYLIENRLSSVSRNHGFDSVHAFIVELQNKNCNPDLKERAIDALTINETSFFRDKKPYEWLENTILPEIIEKNRTRRRLSVWSGASSTGQEIYSLAILLKEKFSNIANWDIELIASDISDRVLAQAKEGVYTSFEVKRGLSNELQEKYFDKVSEYNWKIKDEIRNMVHFEKRNLAKAWPDLGKFDLILLRNVLIYFDLEQKQSILKKLKQHLLPGGHLFLGSSETTYNIDSDWKDKVESDSCSYRLKNELQIGR